MDLAALRFQVETKELLDAKKAVVDLGVAVGNLNKITKEEARSAIDSAKVRKANADAAAKEAIEREKAAKALLAENKATQQSTTTRQSNISVLERQQSILQFMTEGFSRGQATILTYAKASGALTSELKELEGVLQTQRKLIGGDVFDKSMSGLTALKNQYGEIREAIRQYNSDVDLTRNQTRELTRDKERIIEKMKLEGASFTQIKDAVRAYNATYTETAAKVNSLINVEKERERSLRDRTNAIRNIQSAEERLFASVSHLNDGVSENTKINERAALAIGSYERNLRLAGITGEVAAAKIQKFKQAQMAVAEADMANRARYVSRGIGVQMGDVAVSLAGGMNPLLVMIQQGDQIRGLIQQSGLEAAAMGNIMKQAFGSIITSFKDVGIAMGSFVLGGLQTMGKSILDLSGRFLGLKALTTGFTNDMLSVGPPTKNMSALLNIVGAAATAAGVTIAALAVAVIGLGVGYLKSIKEIDNMTKALALNSDKINYTYAQSLALIDSMRDIGVTSATTSKALVEIAKTGGLVAGEFETVIKAANDLNKYADVAIEDTVKKFAELKKDPVEAVKSLASVIDQATAQNILRLNEQGNVMQAQGAIVEAYGKVVEDQVSRMKQEYSDLGLALITIGSNISNFFDNLFKVDSLGRVKEIEYLQGVLSGGSRNMGDMFESDAALRSRLAVLQAQGEADKKSAKEREEQKKQNELNAKASALSLNNLSKEEKFLKTVASLRKDMATATDTTTRSQFQKEIDRVTKEFNEANKKKSDPIQNYYAQVLEKISDLNVKNTGTTLQLTKAEQLLLDVKNDPKWKSISETQRQDVENRIKSAKAIEIETKALKDQKDLQEELLKIQSDYQLKAEESLNEIKNKTALIGLTEEQKQSMQALLKVEQERRATIEKINAAANKKLQGGGDILDVEGQRISKINEMNAFYDLQSARQAQAQNDYQETANSFETGWKEAFAGYTSAAKNSADIGKKAFESMTNGMTDALTEWAMTGKITVRDFANTFIREMVRMQMQQVASQGTNMLGSVFKLALGAMTGGSAINSLVAAGDIGVVGQTNTGFSWSSGGYTGDGGISEPAGIVHKGEVVWSQQDVANAGGVSVVEAMRKGLQGYSNGGVVGSTSPLQSRQGDAPVTVNVTVNSDGTSEVETNPTQSGTQFGNLIAAAVRQEILKEKRNGGMLASTNR